VFGKVEGMRLCGSTVLAQGGAAPDRDNAHKRSSLAFPCYHRVGVGGILFMSALPWPFFATTMLGLGGILLMSTLPWPFLATTTLGLGDIFHKHYGARQGM